VPAMRLEAAFDSACVSQRLNWNGGPLVITLMAHQVQGSAPRLCMWEGGINRCAPLPDIPSGNGWVAYRASVMPDPGTTTLTLYLYADGPVQGSQSIDDYADARVVEVPTLPNLVMLATPVGDNVSAPHLVVLYDSYSTQWASNHGRHVEVDGMLNGWLVAEAPSATKISYRPAVIFSAAQWTSLGGVLVAALLVAGGPIGKYLLIILARAKLSELPRLRPR
jgi:hypothetical protein